jgi:hypothetical protein
MSHVSVKVPRQRAQRKDFVRIHRLAQERRLANDDIDRDLGEPDARTHTATRGHAKERRE